MREGLSHFGLPRANTEMLIIANDSVYGPLAPLDDMLARVDFEKADLWAATESWQTRYHLQSYFMIAGPKALRHPAWAAFWNTVLSVPSKRWVVRRYEVGITQWMIRAGLRCAALWQYENLVENVDKLLLAAGIWREAKTVDPSLLVRRNQARRIRVCWVNNTPLNPTSDLWRQLLETGFPFLKRELLRENPTRVSDIMDWRRVVAETSNSDISAIEQDLQRIAKDRAP
jgi:lipopolysaccharide biosynthesis protein